MTVSREELNEYMSGVRWKTALYFGGWSASVLIAICGLYWGLNARITQSDTHSSWNYFHLDKKIDSLHQIDQSDIKSLSEKIDQKPQPTTFRGRFESYTQKWIDIDGKRTLIYIPIK